MKTNLRFATLLVLFVSSLSPAQYYGERVLQKSFEQSDFFFVPNHLNPLGMKGFASVTPGLVNDPLLNLQINPAILYDDSLMRSYAYLDFRSNREIVDRTNYGYVMPMYSSMMEYDSRFAPYPGFFVSSRKELEPVFSAAFLTRPFSSILPGLFIGATYQMMFQDEKYYAIPQDIYRSTYGYDYAGAKVMDANSIPIVDKYSGSDNMHQTGSFASLHTGYDVTPSLQLGLKVSRGDFARNGAFGSKDFWEYAYGQSSSSTWYNMESREQDYGHWDVAGGINYRLTENIVAGIHAGQVWGNADQALSKLDTSLYQSGQIGVGTNWSYSRRYAVTSQHWSEDGGSSYGGLNVSAQLSESQLLSFYYTYNRQSVDLLLGSTIQDSSTYNYRSQWDTNYYAGTSRYIITDVRTGTGSTSGSHHRLFGVFHKKLEAQSYLSIGISYESRTSETTTNEPVKADYTSSYNYSGNIYGGTNYDSGSEKKHLLWSFKTSLTVIQIPVMFSLRPAEKIELLLGLNRKMSRWEIEEVTTALFDYRDQTNASGSSSKTNFGERYTTPKETISDISTTFLLGVTVFPSQAFNVRLLLTPTTIEQPDGSDKVSFQWWIGLRLYP